MYNSDVELPVPVTVRPLRMLGGGASGSHEAVGADGRMRSSRSQRHLGPSSAASPPPASGCSTSTAAAASPATSNARGAFSTTSTTGASPNGLGGSMQVATPTTPSTTDGVPTPTATRPTITIFTELDDEDDDVNNSSSHAASAWMSGAPGTPQCLPAPTYQSSPPPGGAEAPMMTRQHSALAMTETTLSPLHYRSICAPHPPGDDTGVSTSSFDRMGFAPTAFSSPQPTTDGSGEDKTSNSAPYPPAYASTLPSTSSNGAVASTPSSHGPPPASHFGANTAWPNEAAAAAVMTTPTLDTHPVRLSATPVVPIVPHVAEPSCRRRVAEDLERLYGPNGKQQAATSAAAAASPAPASTAQEEEIAAMTSTTEAPPAAAAAAASSGPSPVKSSSTPPGEPPKKKKSMLFFGSSSSSSSKKAAKAAAAAAEAKKKAAPPTAAERRQAREQVIRVGVQRLYQRLNELHLIVYHVKNDGNCQFRAISHQLFGNEDYHDIIRSQVVSYMRAARAESFDFYFESPAQADAYYDNLAKKGSWGDELSLRAASDCLYVNIHVLSSEERNCYITYRPTVDHAASAPSFLIDVLKLRERRRAERRLLRSHGLQGAASSMTSYDGMAASMGGYRGAGGGGDYSGFGAASTMPDTYARPRSGVTPTSRTTAGGKAPTLLVPGQSSGMSARFSQAAASQPMSREASGLIAENLDDDDDDLDDADVDANAIQLALHKKLQQAEIRCSLPLNATGCSCSFNGAAGGNGGSLYGPGPGASSMPLLQPQRPAPEQHAITATTTATTSATAARYEDPTVRSEDGGSAFLQPVGVPVPRLVSGDEDVTKSAKANQFERFRAVGAEVQNLGDATQSVNIFTQHHENLPMSAMDDDYVRLRQTSDGTEMEPSTRLAAAATSHYPPQQQQQQPALLRPQMSTFTESTTGFARHRPEPLLSAGGNSSSLPYITSPQPQRQQEENGEMMLLACNSHRGRANSSLQQSFSHMQTAGSYGAYNSGSMYGGSFNANPMQSSFSNSFAGGGGGNGAGAQSLGNLVPVSASASGSLLHSGADMAAAAHAGGGGNDGPVSFYKFEPRTEPIDIFLSYLYPVHYNSLSVAQDQQQQQQQRDGLMQAAASATETPMKRGSAVPNSLGSSVLLPDAGEGVQTVEERPKLAPPSISGSASASQYQRMQNGL